MGLAETHVMWEYIIKQLKELKELSFPFCAHGALTILVKLSRQLLQIHLA